MDDTRCFDSEGKRSKAGVNRTVGSASSRQSCDHKATTTTTTCGGRAPSLSTERYVFGNNVMFAGFLNVLQLMKVRRHLSVL